MRMVARRGPRVAPEESIILRMPKAFPRFSFPSISPIIASLGTLRRPLPVLSAKRNTSTCCQLVANAKSGFIREERPYPAIMRGLRRLVLSESQPENMSIKERATAAHPSKRPTANADAPRIVVRKKGNSGTIISVLTSVRKLVMLMIMVSLESCPAFFLASAPFLKSVCGVILMALIDADLREMLKKPLGKIIPFEEALARAGRGRIIAVGDEVVYNMLKAGSRPFVAVFDFSTLRKPVAKDIKEKIEENYPDYRKIAKPAGEVSVEMFEVAQELIKRGGALKWPGAPAKLSQRPRKDCP